MAKVRTFNTELELGDVTIYGIVLSEPERVGASVKYQMRVWEAGASTFVYLSESGTTTVFEGEDRDAYIALVTGEGQ